MPHHDDDTEKTEDITEPETDSEDVKDEAEDEPEAADEKPAKHHEKPAKGLKAFGQWLKAKRIRMVTAIVLGVLLLTGVVLGATDLKYTVLGTVLTTSMDVTVTDASTKQPVPKALVEFGGAGDLTDKSGHVTLKKVKLGPGQLKASKTGYSAGTMKAVGPVAGKGMASLALKPNGIKVEAVVTNTITGGSVEGVEVKSGEASAISDDKGKAILSLPPATNNTTQKLSFNKDGFNTKDFDAAVKTGGAPIAVKLTPAGKVYFQSNRTGRIDIYGANLDGTGAEIVLAGTSQEDANTGILPNFKNPNVMAIVSTRDGRRNGSLHRDLFIFDAQSRNLSKIDTDVDFYYYRAWIGDTLVYTKVKYDPFYGNCNDIKSYELSSGKTSTFFNGAHGGAGCPTVTLSLRDAFIYSVRDAEAAKIGVFMAKPAGSSKRISPTYSDNTVRRAKQTLLSEYYNYHDGKYNEVWDSIDLGNFAVSRVPDGPSIEASRYYNDSPDGTNSAYIEQRDGKSELYLTDGNGGNEKVLTSAGSVNQFVQWYAGEYMVYSVTKPGENALYVISTDGGTPVKIADFYIGNQRTYGGGGNPYN